ncbi:sulfate ABC transporter substrate-binding protein [Tumebacillus permanentifrigoris]|uniref:Sulfate transport system substrate-binding protein n=1 Tax=Tumebacillus permanentifrigoris TaxID=378543 RepID=A0A316D6K7_9BACL|nr:sulfate ABC transporter substrate-binding protein [Tumebacillus permanentifrigoris]PWK10303.1 sulfate transport system substrate-binding protein [Tumebacillus permanentifrigoris]
MKKWLAGVLIASITVLPACGSNTETASTTTTGTKEEPKEVTLVLGAYSVPQEAFKKILPAFQKQWKDKTGQTVNFQESYEASGTQARAIAGGFEADVAVLSLEADIDTIQKAGLITNDWRTKPHNGMITNSVVAFGTREGNPKGIQDWEDLAKPGIGVLYPNPKTSGGAQWDVNGIYGAGLKISEEKGKKDPAYAADLLKRIQKNVKALDKSGRASMTTFENGTGDVVVTYENELIGRNLEGQKYNIIVPNYTILIENPAAVVDKNADKHGVRQVADAFVDYLWTADAQRAFSEKGFRAVDPAVAKEFEKQYKTPAGLYDIKYLGGWTQVRKDLYQDGALWDQILAGK